MIIEETEKAYDVHVTQQELDDETPVVVLYQGSGVGVESFIGIDKHQAAQLIEVLQRWIDGEEIE